MVNEREKVWQGPAKKFNYGAILPAAKGTVMVRGPIFFGQEQSPISWGSDKNKLSNLWLA
jgi:hypothetical protein